VKSTASVDMVGLDTRKQKNLYPIPQQEAKKEKKGKWRKI